MDISSFRAFVIISSLFWVIGICFIMLPAKLKIYRIAGRVLIPFGIIALSIFFLDFWATLSRPPYKTVGEVRLCYAFFYAIISYIIYLKWDFKWFLALGLAFSLTFLMINFFKPENFEISIDPSLQSPWFIIRVIVYIFAFALLGAASLLSIKEFINIRKGRMNSESLTISDNLTYISLGFLTMGLIFGVLWAKQAWGSYWTKDPKELWILLCWMLYILYIHFRYKNPEKHKSAIMFLILNMLILILSWFVFSIIPISQDSIYIF